VQTRIESLSLTDGDGNTIAGAGAFQARLNSTGGLPYTDRSGLDELLNPSGPSYSPLCDVFASEDTSGGPTSYIGACTAFTTTESTLTGVVMEVDYTCTSSGTISLVHGIPSNTAIGLDTDINPSIANDSSGAHEILTINCVVEDEEINVYVEESLKGALLAGGCVLVGDPTFTIFDIVSDNNAIPACDSFYGGPLSDGDPSVGVIAVTITGNMRSTYGDTWYTNQTHGPSGYAIDLNTYPCDLSLGKCNLFLANNWVGESNLHGAYIINLVEDDLGQLDTCDVDIAQTKGAPGSHAITLSASCPTLGNVTLTGTVESGFLDISGNVPACGTADLGGLVSFNNNIVDGEWNCGVYTGVFTLTSLDGDHDGCTDTAEQNTTLGSESSGGLRDPSNIWDFYDVPVGGSGSYTKDRAIAGPDFFALLGRFGATDAGGTAPVNRNSDPLTTPIAAAPAYHPAFDRGPAPVDPNGPNNPPDYQAWDLTQADGAITGQDFFRVLGQFGHNCQ
jgi:hypothetical protein